MSDHNEGRDEAERLLAEKVGPELARKVRIETEQTHDEISRSLAQITDKALKSFDGLNDDELGAVLDYWHSEMIEILMHGAGHHAAENQVECSDFVWIAADTWKCCIRHRFLARSRAQAEALQDQILAQMAKQHSEGN